MNQGLKLHKNISILIHILAWILIGAVLFLLGPLSWSTTLPAEFWYRQLTLMGLLVALFYTNKDIFVPKLLFRGKTWLFLLLTLSICFGLMFLMEYFENLIHLPELMHKAFHPEGDKPFKPKDDYIDLFMLLVLLLASGISTSVATVQKWQADEALRRQLDQQRISSELSYLKAQINPHFFFNTLNNIYSLTSIDVESARIALHKLSRMMRYVLYETEKDQTLLSKEIGFIKDFIELMKLRISDKVTIELDITEHFEDRVVAPMLLLPFVENCFKHGVSSRQPSTISIKIHTQDNALTLETSNKIVPQNPTSPESKQQGIGLTNTKRRLSLLYHHKHELVIDDENPENEYRVALKINLS
ncbi:histidine kinase [Echinicola strongylocentroti]|uniref:Histidine kinase n=1 Tax=Echinicola strongylocentroti TaxID=1795355 RepID=A0A2Z4IEJ6_9BACT|nr:histidine kinase [Echinicola strongylocentroti]AWW29097.1 histidine kinase [Echinicola strongylocentroti]